MAAPRIRVHGGGDGCEPATARPWWIMRLSRETERRLYFLAMAASAVWYLVARFV
jgi:hypothetical protein